MPGIGKTTSILALAHALLGDAFKEGVLELNASDDRSSSHLLIYAYTVEASTSSETESKDSHKRKSLYPPDDTKSSSSMKPTGSFPPLPPRPHENG
jgi:DNA polymerase III delta prime subunit